MNTAQDDSASNPSTGSGQGAVLPTGNGTSNVPAHLPQQPAAPVSQAPVQAPVGGPKEALVSPAPVSEWVSPSTPEVVLPQEVKDAGVEARPIVETIPADGQKSGVRMANSAMTVPTVTEETVNIETQPSVLQHLKKMHKKVSDSLSWLVRLIIKEQDKKARSSDVV